MRAKPATDRRSGRASRSNPGNAANRLIAIDSEDVLAHTTLSMIYHAQGRIEDAEKEGNVAKIMGWKQELRKDTK